MLYEDKSVQYMYIYTLKLAQLWITWLLNSNTGQTDDLSVEVNKIFIDKTFIAVFN